MVLVRGPMRSPKTQRPESLNYFSWGLRGLPLIRMKSLKII